MGSGWKSLQSTLKLGFQRCKKWIGKKGKEYLENNRELLAKFAVYILAYGILINLVSTLIFGHQMWVGSIIGYGVLWYFIKQEVPDFIRSVRRMH